MNQSVQNLIGLMWISAILFSLITWSWIPVGAMFVVTMGFCAITGTGQSDKGSRKR